MIEAIERKRVASDPLCRAKFVNQIKMTSSSSPVHCLNVYFFALINIFILFECKAGNKLFMPRIGGALKGSGENIPEPKALSNQKCKSLPRHTYGQRPRCLGISLEVSFTKSCSPKYVAAANSESLKHGPESMVSISGRGLGKVPHIRCSALAITTR